MKVKKRVEQTMHTFGSNKKLHSNESAELYIHQMNLVSCTINTLSVGQ